MSHQRFVKLLTDVAVAMVFASIALLWVLAVGYFACFMFKLFFP